MSLLKPIRQFNRRFLQRFLTQNFGPACRVHPQATLADRTLGVGLAGFSALVFTYYTVWVLVLPFVDEGQPVQKLFPPRIFAILLPIVAVLLAVMGLGTFIVFVTWKQKSTSKKER
uniref:dolichol phosphate-mannose biosynthesis regulatory protein n=1 Tax=Myxine glutinosa TaxID=7769 RepID=UPI00358DE4D6